MGIVLQKKVGDAVRKGDVLAVLHANDERKAAEAGKRFLAACEISERVPVRRPLIRAVVED